MEIEDLRVYTSDVAGYALRVAGIGENIRRLRIERGFKTQRSFAKVLDVEQPRLSDWENNRYGPPEIGNLLKIAKQLKVSVDTLISGLDDDYDAIVAARSIERETPAAARASDEHPLAIGEEPHKDQPLISGGARHGAPIPPIDPTVRDLSGVLVQAQVLVDTASNTLAIQVTRLTAVLDREFGSARGRKSGGDRVRAKHRR